MIYMLAAPILLGVYAVVAGLILLIIFRRTRRRWLRVIMTLVFFPGLLVFDIPIGRAALNWYCTTQTAPAKWPIATVQGLVVAGDGLWCSSCSRYLQHYTFVETELGRPAHAGIPPQVGKYRFFLAPSGVPECAAYEMYQRVAPWNDRWRWLDAERCVGSVRIDTFSARYMVDESIIRPVGLGIRRHSFEVVDLATDERYQVLNRFSWWGGWFRWSLAERPAHFCPPFGDLEALFRNIPMNVLVPTG